MNNITVLTFHSVVDHTDNRPWAFLSTSVKAFENTLRYLKRKKYKAITLKELYEWKQNGVDDGVKRVLIHFDDGFLDNYTVAYPMLKKYGFKATVFVSPDFVDPRPIVRELQYEKLRAGKSVDMENLWGYMSWEELKKVDSEGVIDVQAHAMTHTWYPCSSELVDLHTPGDNYFWLSWNKDPANKPFWLANFNDNVVPYGYPVFKYAKAISGKCFFPSDEVVRYCVDFYNANLKDWAENKKEYINRLNNELSEKFGDKIGSNEDEAAFKKRLEWELICSKKIDEEKLGKKIEFLAWPGGAVSDLAYEVAEKAGYMAWTAKGKPFNEQKDSLKTIYRVGGWSGIKVKHKPVLILEKMFVRMQLYRSKGTKGILNRAFAFVGNVYRNRHIKKCRGKGENWK